jgi:hypothetical protein
MIPFYKKCPMSKSALIVSILVVVALTIEGVIAIVAVVMAAAEPINPIQSAEALLPVGIYEEEDDDNVHVVSLTTTKTVVNDEVLLRASTYNETFIVQNTSMSVPAPVRHPGQPLHEIVFALPLREDGKIWSGRVSFTASKPIEVEILHIYKPNQNIDDKHGEPYNAVLPGNRSIAISHIRNLVDVPIEINGTVLVQDHLNLLEVHYYFTKQVESHLL